MARFAANLSMLFTELPFIERFAAAAQSGFEGVEYLFPYEYSASEIAFALKQAEVEQVLFNAPPGVWSAGDRGTAAVMGRRKEFAAGIDRALGYAIALDCNMIHVMAGIAADDPEHEDLYVANMRQAADAAAGNDVSLLIEAINGYDMPGYFLSSVRQAIRLHERIDRENVRLQLDLYHAQLTDGNITRLLQENIARVAHIQIASVPDRHEPDGGELSLSHVIEVLDQIGYGGWIGCEYHPRSETVEGLAWTEQFRSER